jgi:hypothetical protein
LNFSSRHLGAGRALYIDAAGTLYVSRGYQIYRSNDWGNTWQLDCFVPSGGWEAWVARPRLGARLVRHCIQAFQVLPDGSRVAVARDGLYRAAAEETRMSRVFHVTRGSRPLVLSRDGQRLLFGEYGRHLERSEVFIYVSDDGGKTFEVGFRFPKGDIQHVHNVLVDPYRPDAYWVFVGDYGHSPGIGVLSKDLRTLDWVDRGCQECRVLSAIVEPDCLLFGTDTDREQNWILRMEKSSGKSHKLLEVDASSFYSAAFGPVRIIATSAEPNPVVRAPASALHASLDGDRWEPLVAVKKDRFNSYYFQFGTLVLPVAHHGQSRGIYSGQALKGFHDVIALIDFSQEQPS